MKIVFFLERQIKKGNLYTLYGDFATLNEARGFAQQNVDDQEVPTGIRISGIKPGKRLFEESYYILDTDGAQIIRTEDTPFESFLIDYSNCQFEKGKVVIEAAKSFTPIKASGNMPAEELKAVLDSFPTNSETKNEYIKVNDVGQGNWNEYHMGEQIPLVYDLGTNMNASKDAIKALTDGILPSYKSLKKPILVISHWDKDHYNCLLNLTPGELDLFACFVIMETIPTATAEKAYKRIMNNPAAKVFAVPNISAPATGHNVMKPLYSATKVSLYQGIGKKSNESGLIVCVSNEKFLSVLSGDCAWFQINHMLRLEASNKMNRCCNLVIPHHGSGKDLSFKGFVIPYSWSYSSSAISVGNNTYKHPNPSVENYIDSLFGGHLSRTDYIKGPVYLKM